MPSFKALLAGAALGVLSLAAAQAGEFVEWKDDGTVLLKLGPDYDDAVITATKDDLGALFGPDEKPFEGEEITVLTLDSGPKGGISGPIYAFRPVFEELTGAKLNIALVPISELYTKLFLDLRNGTGEYDGSIVGAFMYGDLIDGKYILPVDEWRESGDYPQMVVRRDAAGAEDHLHLGRRRLRRAGRRRRPDPLLPPRHAHQPRAHGRVQGAVRLRPAGTADDAAAAQGHRRLLPRQELRHRRRRAGQRGGAAPQGARAGPLPLHDPGDLVRRDPGRAEPHHRASTGSTRST